MVKGLTAAAVASHFDLPFCNYGLETEPYIWNTPGFWLICIWHEPDVINASAGRKPLPSLNLPAARGELDNSGPEELVFMPQTKQFSHWRFHPGDQVTPIPRKGWIMNAVQPRVDVRTGCMQHASIEHTFWQDHLLTVCGLRWPENWEHCKPGIAFTWTARQKKKAKKTQNGDRVKSGESWLICRPALRDVCQMNESEKWNTSCRRRCRCNQSSGNQHRQPGRAGDFHAATRGSRDRQAALRPHYETSSKRATKCFHFPFCRLSFLCISLSISLSLFLSHPFSQFCNLFAANTHLRNAKRRSDLAGP